MKIAVASQNRKTVTGHAGKCRKFWVYDVEGQRVLGRSLLELPIEQSFHETPGAATHPLDGVDALISGGMGQGLYLRLRQHGTDARITTETDPDQAVDAYLGGRLASLPPEAHDHGQHGHGHHGPGSHHHHKH